MDIAIYVEEGTELAEPSTSGLQKCFDSLECLYAEKLKGKQALSLAFLTHPSLRQLHQTWLNDPRNTDVMSFPSLKGEGSLGEICVSVTAAAQRCSAYSHTFSEELTLYLIHGFLHLIGYQDKNRAHCLKMRLEETRCLNTLKKQKRLPTFQIQKSPLPCS